MKTVIIVIHNNKIRVYPDALAAFTSCCLDENVVIKSLEKRGEWYDDDWQVARLEILGKNQQTLNKQP